MTLAVYARAAAAGWLRTRRTSAPSGFLSSLYQNLGERDQDIPSDKVPGRAVQAGSYFLQDPPPLPPPGPPPKSRSQIPPPAPPPPRPPALQERRRPLRRVKKKFPTPRPRPPPGPTPQKGEFRRENPPPPPPRRTPSGCIILRADETPPPLIGGRLPSLQAKIPTSNRVTTRNLGPRTLPRPA